MIPCRTRVRIERPTLSQAHTPPVWIEEYTTTIAWKKYGRDRAGCDCWGLFRLVGIEKFHNAIPPYAHETWDHNADQAERIARRKELAALISGERARQWTAVWEKDKAPADEVLGGGHVVAGDAILMAMMGHPIHVGIVVAPGWMLHIEEPAHGRETSYATCIAYDGMEFGSKVVGFYRWAGERC